MAEHNTLTGADLHEPKGVDAASIDQVYIADGVGSGSWQLLKAHIGGYITFDSATPAYTNATGGSTDVVINPTFTGTHAEGFTALTSPNARFRYDGTEDAHANVSFNCSMKQSSGGTIDVEFVLYLNGAALEGSRVVRSATSGAWGSVGLNYDLILSTNDYLEFFVKTPAGGATILFAQAYAGVTAGVTL